MAFSEKGKAQQLYGRMNWTDCWGGTRGIIRKSRKGARTKRRGMIIKIIWVGDEYHKTMYQDRRQEYDDELEQKTRYNTAKN